MVVAGGCILPSKVTVKVSLLAVTLKQCISAGPEKFTTTLTVFGSSGLTTPSAVMLDCCPQRRYMTSQNLVLLSRGSVNSQVTVSLVESSMLEFTCTKFLLLPSEGGGRRERERRERKKRRERRVYAPALVSISSIFQRTMSSHTTQTQKVMPTSSYLF